jgi:glutamate-1-semialdehyde 2,1-aminomutase
MSVKESENVRRHIMERYFRRTKESKAYDSRAKKYLPGGETRTATYYFPYPAYMERGEGCYLFDGDGNEYVDFLNNFTSLIHGHAHPAIIEAAQNQLAKGTVLGSPSSIQTAHAELLCSRIPSLEKVRYCNSGTEATLFAMRAARAFTQKDVIIKMDGGYHGSHDAVEVNVIPDSKAEGLPEAHLEVAGVPSRILNDIRVAPFNDLESMEILLKKFGDKTAGIILEPMLGSLGMVPPGTDYLQGLRWLADKYGVLLIFDEVITFRLGTGGFQSLEDVKPDLTALGKIIGGGFPVGAFGGRSEIMERFDPAHSETMVHSGTFNGNNITMAAGIAALNRYDRDTIDRINKLGERLREGFADVFKRAGIKAQMTGWGSLGQVHWQEEPIVTAKDSYTGRMAAGELPQLFHLEMMNRGIFSASRGMYALSTPMTENEIEKAVTECEATVDVLKPYIAEVLPELIKI